MRRAAEADPVLDPVDSRRVGESPQRVRRRSSRCLVLRLLVDSLVLTLRRRSRDGGFGSGADGDEGG